MQKIARRALVALGLRLCSACDRAGSAQDTARVRGTIEGMDGDAVCRQDARRRDL